MKIFNVRLGFATNSSSTHTIIYTGGTPLADKELGGDFGWEFFTAASEERKTLYVTTMLYHNLVHQVSNDVAFSVCKDWGGVELDYTDYGSVESAIDHQSIVTFPLDYNGLSISKPFFIDYKNYLLRRGMVILGGNDNSEETHPNLDSGEEVNLPLESDGEKGSFVCRWDDKGYWLLFDRKSGTKVRFSFDDLKAIPTKSTVPELVDLKITDFCSKKGEPQPELNDYGKPLVKDGKPVFMLKKDGSPVLGLGGGGECKYCYQGSTPQGAHASLDDINSILWNLKEAEVMEVAIGGGEPTQHPDFSNIIASVKYYSMVPNFTTRSLLWLKMPWAKQVLEDCGGFAYSVSTARQVEVFKARMKALGYPKGGKKLYVHYVLGTTPLAEFRKILMVAAKSYIRVIVLGYKTTGRGDQFKPYPHDHWLTIIKDLRAQHIWVSVGIDTAVLAKYSAQIEAEGISEVLYNIEEGKFSCYIDAVKKEMAPSSYADKKEFSSFNHNWLSTYSTY